jgi:MFS family permease
VAVFSTTGSVASLAGIWAVRVASRLLIQPFTGALANRWDRRRTLVGGYLLSALLSASLVLVLLEPLLVYPLVFLIQTVEGLVSPTMAAVVPSLVPKEALVSANALRVVLGKVTASLGPALAGLLYGLVGPVWLFLFDALTFAAGAGFQPGEREPGPGGAASAGAGRAALERPGRCWDPAGHRAGGGCAGGSFVPCGKGSRKTGRGEAGALRVKNCLCPNPVWLRAWACLCRLERAIAPAGGSTRPGA